MGVRCHSGVLTNEVSKSLPNKNDGRGNEKAFLTYSKPKTRATKQQFTKL